MKTNTTPLSFTTNRRFKKFAYRVILITALHWIFVLPAQPILGPVIDLYGDRLNNFFETNLERGLEEYTLDFISLETSSEKENSANLDSETINTVTSDKKEPPISSKASLSKIKSLFEGGIFKADLVQGHVGVSKQMPMDNPSDNLFVIQIDDLPQLKITDKVILKYELEGVQGQYAVSRSINGRSAFGGYMVKATKGWTTQEEELNKNWLMEGENEVLFTIPSSMHHQYTIKNVQIEIKSGDTEKVPSLLVLQQDQVQLTKDNNIYIKGFVKGTISGNLNVIAGTTPLQVSDGEFEGLVPIKEWQNASNILRVIATDSSGLLGQEVIFVEDYLMEADHLYDLQTTKYRATVSALVAERNEAFGIAVNTYEDTSAKESIAITSLRAIDIAPFESGMRNVTKNAHAYRVNSTNRINTEKPFKLELEFNPEMIPEGYSKKDIRTFYFDKKEKGWKALIKDSLDVKKNRLISYLKIDDINNGTDYINGIIQTPEASSTSSFMPTMMNDIKAVDPSAAMTLITPPVVSQRGDANISYPIRIPAGRNGMQPNVGLRYSSEGGNGWLGLGWSMNMPSVNLDTRWGAPIFDTTGESELYNLNGEMLMYPNNFLPHRHAGDEVSGYDTSLQNRTEYINDGAKIFTPRKQGGFAKIERYGTTPENYYWKTTDASGTVSWYGGYDGNLIDNTIVRNDANNIVHWALYKVEDVFGNNMVYTYTNENIGATGDNLSNGTYFYCDSVIYTGHNTTNGAYKVQFILDESNVKLDVNINAKLGLKWIDPYLLKNIEISYNNNLIRSYELDYIEGRFTKNLLEWVAEKDKEGNEFYRHDFQYYDDVQELNGGNLYTAPQTIELPDYSPSFANSLGGLIDRSEISANQSIETGFRASISAGIEIRPAVHSQNKRRHVTFGAPFGENSFKNKGKVTLSDIDGDGLDDLIYRTGNGLEYFRGQLELSDQFENRFEYTFLTDTPSNALPINNASDYYRSKGFSKTIFGESYDLYAFGFFGSKKRVKTKSESTVYFVDGNGDNIMDIVKDEVVYFNTLDEATGGRSFVSSSAESENMVITDSSIPGLPDDPDPQDQVQQALLDFDAVRVWIAPRDGTVAITDKIQSLTPGNVVYTIETSKPSLNNGDPFRMFFTYINTSSQDVTLHEYENGAPLGLGVPSGPIVVDKGQKLYFRVHSGNNNPEINSSPRIVYDDGPSGGDEIGKKEEVYEFAKDFCLDDNTGVAFPGTGIGALSMPTITVRPTDDITFEVVQRFWNTDGDLISEHQLMNKVALNLQTTVISNADLQQPLPHLNSAYFSTISFEALSDSNALEWSAFRWNMDFIYQPNQDAIENQGIPDMEITRHIVPDYPIYRATNYDIPYGHVLAEENWQSPAIPPSGNNSCEARPAILSGTPAGFTNEDNGTFVFVVKLPNYTKGKIRIDVIDGVITPESTIPIGIFDGDLDIPLPGTIVSFIGYYSIGKNNKELLRKYIDAAGINQSVEVSYNWSNPNAMYTTGAHEYYNNEMPHLGPLYRGWGQFFYNENYDGGGMAGDVFGNLINKDIVENPELNHTFSIPGVNCPQDENYAQCVQQSLNLPSEGTVITAGDLDNLFGNLDGMLDPSNFEYPEISFVPGKAQRMESLDSEKWIGLSEAQFSAARTYRTVNYAGGGNNDGGNSGPFSGIIQDEDDEGDWGDANGTTGMHAINKVQKSSSKTLAGGYGPVALNNTETDDYNNTVSDFIDINGDRYPDAVYPQVVTKSNMTGGHKNMLEQHLFGEPGNMYSSGQSISLSGSTNDLRPDKSNASESAPAPKANAKGNLNTVTTGPPMATLGINVNIEADSEQTAIFLDINGDGLVDRVAEEGGSFKYRLNKGGFNINESTSEIFPNLFTGGRSEPGTFDVNVGLPGGVDFTTIFGNNPATSNILSGSIDFNIGVTGSNGTTRSTFQDVNGDGLQDVLISDGNDGKVRFNLGNKFGPITSLTTPSPIFGNPNLKQDSRSRGVGAAIDAGIYFGFPVCCGPVPTVHLKFGVTLGGSMSLSITDTEKAFKDMNGDGYLDYVKDSGDDLVVYYSAIGRTNKLRTVNNPLGGSFSVDYNPNPKTADNPNSKWVMKSVTVDDGYHDIVNDGEDQYVTEFRYDDAKYDRREREFYGFETVKVFDYRDENLTDVYRTTTTQYHNKNYYLQGLVKLKNVKSGGSSDLSGFSVDIPDNRFTETENEYTIYGLQTDNQHLDLTNVLDESYDVGGTEGRGSAVAVLTKTTNRIIERTANEIVSEVTMEYDDLARVSSFTNHGDVDQGSEPDEYTTTVTYHDDAVLLDKNLINIPKSTIVSVGNEEMRERFTTNIDLNTGTVGRIKARINNDDLFSESDMTYDEFGNLSSITYPENASGERMSYSYTYDQEGKYRVQTQDAFGYTSSASYDPEFDTILQTIDITNSPMQYEYDAFGRTTKIIGPKEIENPGTDFTIQYRYYTKHDQLTGVANIPEEAFMPVGVTEHFDVQHPDNTIKTITFIDGLSRIVQVKKDIEYESFGVPGPGSGNEKMSITGKVTYDHLGRAIQTYHPWHENTAPDLNYQLNNYQNINYFSETIYDQLDRVKETIDAAGNKSFSSYTVSNNLHKSTSRIEQNDANEITSMSFSDARGRKVKTIQVGPDGNLETLFTYNAINELEAYTDADNITTYFDYDLLGRKIRRIHPDNGVTEFFFDNANNLIKMQTEKMAIADEFITYDYEFNRLIKSNFPDGPGGEENIANVTISYGAANSGFETGRIIEQTDGTGIQTFTYGNMGELVHNTRTVIAPSLPARTFDTSFAYDSWNRVLNVQYPDGELVNYNYNLGGQLNNVQGGIDGSEYMYIKNTNYDYFGQTTSKEFGNGTRATYTYEPELRRLSRAVLFDGANTKLLDNHYTYNKASNVTRIKNLAGSNNEYEMGGNYTHNYSYDILNRLSEASGGFNGNGFSHPEAFNSSYSLTMEYNNSHGIANKKQQHNINNTAVDKNTYNRIYTYIEGTHKLEKIEEPAVTVVGSGFAMNFDYDVNGNITNVNDTNGNNSNYYWDESNRLRVVHDIATMRMHHYIYDASNQRIFKSSSDPTAIYENGSPVESQSVTFENYTTYPSSLIVVKPDGEYTKHYFSGGQRILSRIGDGDIDFATPISGDGTLIGKLKSIQQRQIQDLQKTTIKSGVGTVEFKKYVSKEDALEVNDLENDEVQKGDKPSESAPGNIYFFHGDHLGSASFITDASGDAYQFFANLPFGETMIEQKNTEVPDDYENRYKFNGKELDTETGLYYYGARYYNPSTSVWLSVDPMADAMPSWNSYNYTMQNPINLIDPDGMMPNGPGDPPKWKIWLKDTWEDVKYDWSKIMDDLDNGWFDDKEFVLDGSAKADIGLQIGVNGKIYGVIDVKGKLDVVSFELINGKVDLTNPGKAESYMVEHILNGDGKGVKYETGIDVIVGIGGKEIIGGNYKSVHRGHDSSSEQVAEEGGIYFIIPLAKIKNSENSKAFQNVGLYKMPTKVKASPNTEGFYGLDFGLGVAIIIGINANLKIGWKTKE
ncbi:hypothetical protein A9Q86_15585 [Flavobacteriales bacterium 33_180_T64]|nr:hypothetical protein A9Q86_15585 [Flavobacteriales bacterium 33_180_T64]